MKRVVLCRPEGPRNVGMILRVALNFGPTELCLVAPLRPSMLVHPEFEQMSHGAEAARAEIRVVATLEEALADCVHAVGFSGRAREKRKRADWRRRVDDLGELADDPGQRLALVFGNETSGLTEDEARQCHELAHLRTSDQHTSLNLAMCVGVVLSGLFRGTRVHQRESNAPLLDGKGRAFLKARLHAVLADQVARTPSARRDVAAMIDRVFSRAPLENRDARAWHLLLRALGSDMTPTDLGLELHEKGGRRARLLARHDEDPQDGEAPESGLGPDPPGEPG